MAKEERIMPQLLTRVQVNNTNIWNMPEKTAEKKMVVPDYKVKEVLMVIDAMEEKRITSQELAEQLQITKRSANRILSALEEQGVVEIKKTRATSAKGRPERVYGITHLQL